MQVAKWGNSLAIRIPKAMAEELRIQEGDDVKLRAASGGAIEISRDDSRARAIARIRELACDLPADYKFDRDEANAR